MDITAPMRTAKGQERHRKNVSKDTHVRRILLCISLIPTFPMISEARFRITLFMESFTTNFVPIIIAEGMERDAQIWMLGIIALMFTER